MISTIPCSHSSAISLGDHVDVMRMVDQVPDLVSLPLRVGASRQDPRPYFVEPIRHYVYEGGTALL